MTKLFTMVGAILLLFTGCSPRGSLTLFKNLSPHDQYAEKLKSAGLDKTGAGKNWLSQAESVYSHALEINLPYKETGYFAAEKTDAVTFLFNARRGQKLTFLIAVRPAASYKLFADVSQLREDGTRKQVATADSAGGPFDYEIKKDGLYLLRLQPELLMGGEYTLTITSAPSLAFPVAISGHPAVGSFWGDARDAGGRKHEGIDIFAPKTTPAIAAKGGTVSRVTENNLGGKVVFMQPEHADYTLYYAHLETQLVRDGQQVRAGDTIGLVGTTGNARNTPAHLHFGIYTGKGAIDPLPFIDRTNKKLIEPQLSLSRLNDTLRVRKSVKNSTADQPVRVIAIHADRYKVLDVYGRPSWLKASELSSLSTLRVKKLASSTPLYDRPDTNAARKLLNINMKSIAVIATVSGFEMVRTENQSGWIKSESK